MSKKKKQIAQSRDAPEKRSSSWLCSPEAFKILTTNGYTRLADCPEVRMCVHAYADLISDMTIYLMQNTDKGDVRVKNGLSRKIDIEPNRLIKTRKSFIYNIVWTLMLPGDGNQVTYPHFSVDGMLEDLIPLRPSRVQFLDTATGYAIRYGDKIFTSDEVLHFVINPDPERPWIGTGDRTVLKDVIKGIKQAGITKQALLESPSPSIIVKVDGLTDEFASLEGRKALGKQYLDDSESGRPWFIPAEAFDVKEIKPLTLNDLALAKNLEIDKRTVAGIFRIPPFLVGVGNFDRDEYNKFIGSEIMSLAQALQQEMTRGLLYSSDYYWWFNPRSLYSYSISEITKVGGAMVDRMAMRRNEWRQWIGMTPDPEMEELLALENFIPADRLGDQKKLIGGEGNKKGQNNDEDEE